MNIYEDLANTALELLVELGQSVTRIATTASEYDQDTLTITLTPVSTARRGVTFGYKPGITQVKGQLVQATDLQLLLDANGPVAVTDQYVVGSKTYTVVSIDTIAPAGILVLHDLHIRAGA